MTAEPRSCRRATELLSAAMDRPLTRKERMFLRLHLPICTSCRRFRRQLGEIRDFIQRLPANALPGSFITERLSDAARERLTEAVRQASRGS